MEKEVYMPMEQVLIRGALLIEALQTKQKMLKALELDQLLLEMEQEQGLQDGFALEGGQL